MIRTRTLGISQSDVLIREAILAGIAELRRQEWLLDYVWAGLAHDPLLKDKYGDQEIERAKAWFRNNEITVVMAENMDDPKLPAITIHLLESAEAEPTLGDIHYDPDEEIESPRPRVILGPFTPASYNHASGLIELPHSLSTESVFEGQFVYDGNAAHQIVDVGRNFVGIAPNTNLNTRSLSILPAKDLMVVSLESLLFRETYRLGLVVRDHPAALHYLYGVTMFCLLRGKEEFLERRGLERTTVRAGELSMARDIQTPENMYSRYIDVAGYVRNYWPKQMSEPVEGIKLYDGGGVRILANTVSPSTIQQAVTQGWTTDLDELDRILDSDGISPRPPPIVDPPPPATGP
jgi:hypothetical protein